jgi:hypothetical protein
MEEVKAEMKKHRKLPADEIELDREKVMLERGANQTSFHSRIGRTLERNLRRNDEFTVIQTRKDGVTFASTKPKKLAEQLSGRTLHPGRRK